MERQIIGGPTRRLVGGIDFGPVWGASGVQGFFGEGYPHHMLLQLCPGFDFEGMTFVAKTTTVKPRLNPQNKEGNMHMKNDGITPKKLLPDCIVVKPTKGVVLNAVGLSGPGAKALFGTWRWQERLYDPFFLSFMSLEKDVEARLKEVHQFVDIFDQHTHGFKSHVGLQINWSCPNVGLQKRDPQDLIKEVHQATDIFAQLNIPIVHKFSVTTDPQTVFTIAQQHSCAGICISNTIPWGYTSDRVQIDWKKLFGATTSPLAKYGGGGLSGAPVLPIVAGWVKEIRDLGFDKHINAGGGVLHSRDVHTLAGAGADSVFIGSCAIVRPWRVASVIREAHRLLG